MIAKIINIAANISAGNQTILSFYLSLFSVKS